MSVKLLTYEHHLIASCVHTHAASGAEVPGFESLTAAEQAAIEGYIAEGKGAKTAAAAAKVKVPKAAAGTKRKADKKMAGDDEDSGEEEEEAKEEKPAKKPAAKRAKKATKVEAADDEGEKEEEEEKPAKKPAAKRGKKGAVDAEAAPAAAAGAGAVATHAATPAPTAFGPGWSPRGAVVHFAGFSSAALEAAVISWGGEVAKNLTRAVTLVVTKTPDTSNKNVVEAKARGVPVVAAADFGPVVGVAAGAPAPAAAPLAALPGDWSPAGQVVLFTGFRSAPLTAALIAAGAEAAKSFTNSCTLVVAKDSSVDTGKVAEARAKGVRVCDSATLANWLGVTLE